VSLGTGFPSDDFPWTHQHGYITFIFIKYGIEIDYTILTLLIYLKKNSKVML